MSKPKSRKVKPPNKTSTDLPQQRPEVARRIPREDVEGTPTKGELAIAEYYRETRFSGPLPDPQTLAGYERVCSGAADRIIRMAEGQAEHRQGIERTVITANSKNQTTGVWFAGLLSLGIVGLAALLIWKDMELWGLAAVVLQMASLCGVFFYSKRSQKKELREKRKAMEALAKANGSKEDSS